MTNEFQKGWDEQHSRYARADWIDKPTLFAQWAVRFFPPSGELLDVGCGQGQDARYFGSRGHNVTGIDFSAEGLKYAREKLPKELQSKVRFGQADISEKLPFSDTSFDIVYSHLAVHYFDRKTTAQVIEELARVLKKGGILALLVNSVNDPEYGTGEKLEDDYFIVRGVRKHFFSAASLGELLSAFETVVLDEKGETYKDCAVSTDRLVRFVGKKI